VTVTIGFHTTFDFGQVGVGQQFGPATEVKLCLSPLWWQLDGQCSHGRTIVRIAGGGQFWVRAVGMSGPGIRREFRACRFGWHRVTSRQAVKLLLDNLPPTLANKRETLADCLEAMDRVLPLTAVYLFGSHARGESARTAMWTCVWCLSARPINSKPRNRSAGQCDPSAQSLHSLLCPFRQRAWKRRKPRVIISLPRC
jgi:hypothetical protein